MRNPCISPKASPIPRDRNSAPQMFPAPVSKSSAQAMVTSPQTAPTEISMPPPIMTMHMPRVTMKSAAFRLKKSKKVWNCRKLTGKLIRAIPYMRIKIIPAMINRSVELDILVFGLPLFRGPILLLLLRRTVHSRHSHFLARGIAGGDPLDPIQQLTGIGTDHGGSDDHEDDDKHRLERFDGLGVYLQTEQGPVEHLDGVRPDNRPRDAEFPAGQRVTA